MSAGHRLWGKLQNDWQPMTPECVSYGRAAEMHLPGCLTPVETPPGKSKTVKTHQPVWCVVKCLCSAVMICLN